MKISVLQNSLGRIFETIIFAANCLYNYNENHYFYIILSNMSKLTGATSCKFTVILRLCHKYYRITYLKYFSFYYFYTLIWALVDSEQISFFLKSGLSIYFYFTEELE